MCVKQSTGRAQYQGNRVLQALKRIRQAARQRKKEKFHRALPSRQYWTINGHHYEAFSGTQARLLQLEWTGADTSGLRADTLSAILRIYMLASIEERIGHYRRGVFTYPNRMVGNARLRSPPLRTRSSRGATAAVLSAIYEEDFLGFSYGFRPGRATHVMRWMRSWSGSSSTKVELDTGRRHPLVLRHDEPGVAPSGSWNTASATDVSSA